MGNGQPNRLESLRISMRKAGDEVKGAFLASDAFFFIAWNDTVEKVCEASIGVVAEHGAVSPSLHMPVVSPSSPSVSLTNSVLPLVSPHSASLPSSSTGMSSQPSSYLPSPALSPLPLDPDFYPERLCVVLPLSPINIHPMTTRSKNGISKKKAYSATVQSLDLSQLLVFYYEWKPQLQLQIVAALKAEGFVDSAATVTTTPWFVPDRTKEKFDGNGSDAIGIKGHNSAPVSIDGHKSDAIDIDKDLVGDEKDIEIAAVMVWFPTKEIPRWNSQTWEQTWPTASDFQ
uniref:Uncharacterized protein n=1 Tax=Populus alba TaxID=43335 RepID=A0A4U5QHU1_POPAL|nr:hypothetical protein D5086_0000085690 [Populus alba]